MFESQMKVKRKVLNRFSCCAIHFDDSSGHIGMM